MIVTGNIVIVDGWQFEIDRSVPKIVNSLGKEEPNEQIKLSINQTLSKDYVKSTIQIEIEYEKEISYIQLNEEEIPVPEKKDEKYILKKEVTNNGKYYVVVKDSEQKYQTGIIEVKDITEDMNIWTKADMKLFRDRVNSGRTYQGRTVNLMADIDLQNEEWVPIGAKGIEFSGIFNGNRKYIRGLSITNSYQFVGLFSIIGIKGKVNNLDLDCNINVNDKNNEEIVKCTSVCTGGICGRNKGEIYNCQVSGNISYEKNSLESSLYDVWVGNFVGGIAGLNNNKIYKCFSNNLNVSGIHNHPNQSRGYGVYVGGIVGVNRSENEDYYDDYQDIKNILPEIYSCYSFAIIKGTDYTETDIGGIAGLNQSLDSNNIAYIHNCYAILNSHSQTTSYYALNKGHIVGLLSYTTKLGGNLYVKLQNSITEYQFGPLPIVQPYGSVECSNLQELINNIYIIGEDFTEDKENINNGYPILKWQVEQE